MRSPAPPFAVPVVRLILKDGHRALLLQRAEGTYGGGGWCLPGGKIDYGQTVEEVVRKELKEETNLDLGIFRFLFYQDGLPLEPGGMHCLNLYFECTASGNLALNRESSCHAWVAESEMTQYEILFGNAGALSRHFGEISDTRLPHGQPR